MVSGKISVTLRHANVLNILNIMLVAYWNRKSQMGYNAHITPSVIRLIPAQGAAINLACMPGVKKREYHNCIPEGERLLKTCCV